jgi:hypothetical protein
MPFWEANSSSASQEISLILCNPNVHDSIYMSTPTVPIPSQTDPVHSTPPHFSKIHFNIILPCTTQSSKWSPSLRFPH